MFLRSSILESFSCLGDACEDTCCKGWNMQVNAATCDKYAKEAPELLAAVADPGLPEARMRRDEADYCVKFENGLCGIYKRYGPELLGDACYFYPRATRRLGERTLMTATLSCPEIARLALLERVPVALNEKAAPERLPQEIRDYLPEGVSAEGAFSVHEAFMHAATDIRAEAALDCFIGVAHALSRLPSASWPEAVRFHLKNPPQAAPEAAAEDPYNLLHALSGLIVATHLPRNARLNATIEAMESALGAALDWENVSLTLAPESHAHYLALRETARAFEPGMAQALSRWLQFQLSSMLFPFAGLGSNPAERIVMLAVRFATFRLAMLCACGVLNRNLEPEEISRIAQSLARVLDHLADAEFSLKAYAEAGWTREKRLRGLVQL